MNVLSSYRCLFRCVTHHSELIHNLCKVMQGGSDVLQVNFYISSTQHLRLLLFHLPSFAHICPLYLAALRSPWTRLLINCACVPRPKNAMPRALYSILYLSVLILKGLFFFSFPFSSPCCPAFLLLTIGEGHGMHHPQWFTAVPVLPSGL